MKKFVKSWVFITVIAVLSVSLIASVTVAVILGVENKKTAE